jgi:NADH:ubiquinone oxidoreductase subunit 3 (subunit A)
VYELAIFLGTSLILECGIAILYGVAAGFDPLLVFASALTINLITIFATILLVDALMRWKKGVKTWIEKKLARGQRLIDKYAWIGVIAGVFVLSPIQIAIIGRLIGVKPSRLYPSLIGGTVLVALAFMGIALGVFKLALGW